MIRVLALLVLLLPAVARAQSVNLYCLTGTSSTGNPTWAPASATNPCPIGVSGAGPTSTYQGTLAVTTSAAISTLTLSNSTTFPSPIGKMVIINTGANTAYICWFGGTCSAGSGSEPLLTGASDTIYLGNATTSPTAFSTSGTTLAIHN